MTVTVSSSVHFPELEKYEFIEEIGHGGMATVYRARDLRLDREVAVKVIHKHLRENVEVRRRFVSEAKAVAKLRHRGIVEVYDVSAQDDVERYLVVELIRGMSLRQLLTARGTLPPEIAAIMVSILCDAVEHAHRSGVIHRDIKPENVLLELPEVAPSEGDSDSAAPVDTDGSVRSESDQVVIKLTDFGIAKVLDAQGVTSTGQILGSPAHMAPEQIEGGAVGPHTDVFALGVLLYECMVGHLPFEGNNPAQVLRRVLDGCYEAADAERPEIGGRWARILAAALELDVEARVPRAEDFGALIRAELGALEIPEPRTMLADYFRDEDGYTDWVRDALVPRLVKRGEVEKKGGHIPGAAADFNRALALKPDDLAILKRITLLSAETVWKERAARFGAIATAAVAVFGATLGITKWISHSQVDSPVPLGSVVTESIVSLPPSTERSATVVHPPPRTDQSVSTTPSSKKDMVVPTSKSSTKESSSSVGLPTGSRAVGFNIIPAGATLVVDGATVNWFGKSTMLSIGSHSYSAQVSGECCKQRKGSFVVPPPEPGQEDRPHHVTVRLEIKPAVFVLKGAPPGSSVSCGGATAAAGSPGNLTMTKVQWAGTCRFSNGVSLQMTLPAGRTTTVAWPG